MMLEEQLKRFWFFQKLDAFSIDPGDDESISSDTVHDSFMMYEKKFIDNITQLDTASHERNYCNACIYPLYHT